MAKLFALLVAISLVLCSCQMTGQDQTEFYDSEQNASQAGASELPSGTSSSDPTEKTTDAPEDDKKLVLPKEEPKPASDPYANVNKSKFYEEYEPADSYWDA